MRQDRAAILERAASLGGYGAFIYDPEADHYLYCSAVLAQLHGLTPEDFLAQVGRPAELLARIHPDDRAKYRAALDRAVADGEGYRIEYRLAVPHGGVSHLRETAERLDGGARLIGCVQDVSELAAQRDEARAAAAEARATSARLLGAAEAVSSGVAILDGEGRLAYFNRRYRELAPAGLRQRLRLGERLDEAIRSAVAAGPIYHPSMGDDPAGRRLAQGRTAQADYEMQLADGRWIRILETAVPDGGRVLLITDVSERKSVETALRESEARLAAFMEHAPIGIQVKDAEGRYVLVNTEFCRLVGRSAMELIGRTAAEIWPPECAGPVDQADREVLASGRGKRGEEQFSPDGEQERWKLVIRFPIRGADGTVTHVGGFHLDITERRAFEERLKASEQRFRALTEAHPVPVVITSLADDRILYASPPLAEMLGVPDYQLIGSTTASFWLDPAARQRIVEQVRRLGVAQAEEVRLHRADGSDFWVALTSRLITFDDRECTISGITDLADRRRAEAVDQLLHTVIDAVPAVIHVKDREFRYQLANRYYLDQWGLRPEDVIGKSQKEVFQQELAFAWSGETDDRDARVVATGEPTGFYEVAVPVHKQGPMVLWANKLPLKDESGAVVHILTVGSDVTELKRAEQEIARQREALHQSEKLNALGSMLASVAHELNNPLSVVMGYATMMCELAPDPATRHRAERVRAAADRCARIVKTFLALVRQKPGVHQPVQLNDIVEAALEVADYGLRSHGVEVTVELDPELPLISGDGDQLTLVLMNLIVNAQQAVHGIAPPRQVTIRTLAVGDQVCLEVADNGPGFGADVLDRIFEPFFTTKPEGSGTGIGLSVCQSIVRSHGGAIRAANRPGGAIFTVELPSTAVHAAPSDGRSETALQKSRGRILVVDDEPDLRRLLVDILERDGYAVQTAASGREALDLLDEHAIDLIISDLRMPGLDGPGLYQELRERRSDLLPRLMFITGATLAPDVARFLSHTMAEVIEKPFDPDDLLQRVRSCLAATASAELAMPGE